MSYAKTLVIKTKMAELEMVEATLEEASEEMSWPDKFTNQMQLILEELVVNVIHYGHEEMDDPSFNIHISLTAQADEVVVEIIDDGKPFNPLQDAPQPDTQSDVEDRNIGGLGVYLVRRLADDIQYCREQNMNKLTVIKKIKSDKE